MWEDGWMALPRDYTTQACSLARALEVVGERWTLLILRDAFYGVRRFSDFLVHLKIPRAVLADRLGALVSAGVLERVAGPGSYDEYALTGKGTQLWPAVRCLTWWGDDHYAPAGPRRVLHHATCGTEVDQRDVCPACDAVIEVKDLIISPGPGLPKQTEEADPVTIALQDPHRLLEPLDTKGARLVPHP
jgi:DNA-binding HxlR family transcriptional regulator